MLLQTSLNCVGSGLGLEDARLISELLCHHRQVKSLFLDNNPAIGDLGAVALSQGVSKSSSVERISLRKCGVARAGASAFAELVKIKPGVVVRATGGNVDIPNGLRRTLEDHERAMQFDVGADVASGGGEAVAITTLPERRRPIGRDRLVDANPILAPGGCVAPRTCRLHVMGDYGAGKRTLVASLARGWAASLVAGEDVETSDPPLPLLTVVPPMILANGVNTATWLHGDVGNVRWLQYWSDAVFIIVVDLNAERDKQEKLIMHHIGRIQAAAPINATIVLVGSKSDKLGKLGEEYLMRLVDSVSERIMSLNGVHGPPPPISSVVAMDCRKSQSMCLCC
jgi:hypothetical protein